MSCSCACLRSKKQLLTWQCPLALCYATDFEARKAEIQEKNSQLADAAEQVLNVIANPEVAGQLKQDKDQNMIWLKEHYGVRRQPARHLAPIRLPC